MLREYCNKEKEIEGLIQSKSRYESTVAQRTIWPSILFGLVGNRRKVTRRGHVHRYAFTWESRRSSQCESSGHVL